MSIAQQLELGDVLEKRDLGYDAVSFREDECAADRMMVSDKFPWMLPPVFSNKELRPILEAAQQGGMAEKLAFVGRLGKLIMKIANKFTVVEAVFDDLVMHGADICMKEIDDFDFSKSQNIIGYFAFILAKRDFPTLIEQMYRGCTMEAARYHCVRASEMRRALVRENVDFTDERDVPVLDAAKATSWESKTVAHFQQRSRPVLSMDFTVENDDGDTSRFSDVIPSDGKNPEAQTLVDETRRVVNFVLSKRVGAAEALIVRRMFGLRNVGGSSVDQVCRAFNGKIGANRVILAVSVFLANLELVISGMEKLGKKFDQAELQRLKNLLECSPDAVQVAEGNSPLGAVLKSGDYEDVFVYAFEQAMVKMSAKDLVIVLELFDLQTPNGIRTKGGAVFTNEQLGDVLDVSKNWVNILWQRAKSAIKTSLARGDGGVFVEGRA